MCRAKSTELVVVSAPMADEIHKLGVAELVSAYRQGSLSPVEVTEVYLDRAERFNDELNAYVVLTSELALEQAQAAERAYTKGEPAGPLAGVPISVKDAFYLAGVPTTHGSLIHRDQVAKDDSGVVRRLRASGAVFIGKTNVPEFCQSATTENLLGPATGNPWDPARTAGGSSGGAAASVGAGLATMAVGSDGGGSVRIPAAFCGLYGLKPSLGVCPDENGLRCFGGFASAGPLASRVADARAMLGVLADSNYSRRSPVADLRVRYCPNPLGQPVDRAVASLVEQTANRMKELGHQVVEGDVPLDGWEEIFAPLVLEDEHRERGHLLQLCPEQLTSYERASLRAAEKLSPSDVRQARERLPAFRYRVDAFFDDWDIMLTPATAVPAFPLGERPAEIGGQPVHWLWGAFPFTPPLNVAGVTAASVPCGFVDGMPVAVQLVARAGAEQQLLDVSEQLEEAIGFDRSLLDARWSAARSTKAVNE